MRFAGTVVVVIDLMVPHMSLESIAITLRGVSLQQGVITARSQSIDDQVQCPLMLHARKIDTWLL